METNIKFVIYSTIWMIISNTSVQIYVPHEGIDQKPITYTSGIKTSSYHKPLQIDHNYSKVYQQNSFSYNQHSTDGENDETTRHPYPVYNAHTYGARPPQSERLMQVYVLNGTRIQKNENPTRQIVKYNKEKRSSKIEVYRTCPKNATGQLVYEFSCNQFLNCWRGRGFIQNCAPGTLFNPKTLECDFPEKVYCVSGPRQSILQKDRKLENIRQIGCPKEFSGLIPNYTDCSKFINCVSGIENLMDCPPGTLFDIDKNICDFAHKAHCFSGQNRKVARQNIDGKVDLSQLKDSDEKQDLRYRFNEVRCPNDAVGLHKHPVDCSKFLNCANGQTYVQDCAPGTLFNPSIKICDFPYNVRCENGTGGTDNDYVTIGTKKSVGDYNINRNEWNSGSKYSSQHQNLFIQNGQRQYVPYSTTSTYFNGNSYSEQGSPSDRRQIVYSEDLSGNRHFDQNTQTQYNRESNSQGSGFHSTSTKRYGEVSGDYGSGYYDSSTTRYRATDNLGSTSSGSASNLYQNNHNRYQQGSMQQGIGIYGSPTLSRPNQNVNMWNEQNIRPYAPQNQYTESQSQQELGVHGSGVSRPYQNIHGYHRQTSHIYSTPNEENQGYQQHYNIKGSNDGQYQNVYQGQKQNHVGSGYNKGSFSGDTSWDSNQYTKGSGIYNPSYGGNGGNLYGRPESGNYANSGVNWGPSLIDQKPLTGYDHSFNQGQQTFPYQNNQNLNNNQLESSNHNRRPFSTQYPESSTFVQSQRNEWQQGGRDETNYNRGHNLQNTLDEDEVRTTNYDEIVNINQVRKSTLLPFLTSTTLKPLVGPTGEPGIYDSSFISGHSNKFVRATTPSTWKSRGTPVSQTNDYDDTFVPDQSNKFVSRATTPQTVEKIWPPPFPSTDVNADYVFEYDDNDQVTLEAENSFKHNKTANSCGKSDFRCSNDKCILKSFVCNSFKDCPNGEDELNCLEYISRFSVKKDRKLAILEKEKWNNVSIATCALLCVESQKFNCRSFNYRKIDKTCFLTNTNEGLTGAIISYYPFDYYELNSEKLNCSGMYVCENRKCIDRKKICDGVDDCGDRMDERGCKPQDYGYSTRLLGSKNTNEGYVEVTAFGKTGVICDDQFGLRDASVVCRELGFHLGAVEVKPNSFFAKNLSKPFYMMDDLGCIGNESKLMDCDFSGWGVHNCLEQEIVGVVCKTPSEKCASDYWQCDSSQECVPLAFVCDGVLDCTDSSDEGSQHCDAPTQIRLVNGSTREEGRVEIRRHGVWGTICDDDFNEDAAKVICRQLGHRGSAVVKKDAHFGSGSGPIWLDQVFCAGNETKVEDCSHWNWGEHNCEHSEDVGVICRNKYDYEERHQSVVSLMTPQTYPERCGYRNDNIFNQDDDVHFRVVRGSIAKKGDYPWQAAVRIKGKSTSAHWCGAVIISERFVLTAAHCLIGYSKGAYVVVAGDYNVDESEGTEQESYIEDYYLHENFRQGHKMNNDIALIKLKGNGFRLGGDVQAICLPDANANYETERNCTISGFGSIESGKSAFSHNLRAGWVPLQKREICAMPHVYGDALTEGMICAGSLDEGVDSCDGDSGGPLACLDNGVFTLYGLTSWGQHCGRANKPGVYVKVAHYRKWIDDNFKKYSIN